MRRRNCIGAELVHCHLGEEMNEPLEFIIQFLSQFAGGPGPPENNLVRFGLAALFWIVLLGVTWSRQREVKRPREQLLLAGFALAAFREIYMFSQQTLRIVTGTEHDALCRLTAPLEHSLSIAAMVLIAGSFLRYLLDDARVARSYLLVGLGATGILSLLTFLWWPIKLAATPGLHFHSTWPAWAFHLLAAILLLAALLILAQKRGWLRNVIVLALLFFVAAELIVVANLATARSYSHILCPIGNSLYLWAIPLFGYVYLREQGMEKKRAEKALQTYRDHLADLVEERTAELAEANARLEQTATLEERQRIAANLHDGLAQTLSYVSMVSSQAETLLHKGDFSAAALEFERIHLAVDRAITEVRQCISSLREDPPPQQSLQEALQEMLSQMAVSNGPDASVLAEAPGPIFLEAWQMEEVRRTAQEAVTNALQHAAAQCITVTVGREQDACFVAVADDGRGFDRTATHGAETNHFGLSIMAARAERLDGTLQIDSRVGSGTEVVLRWPAAIRARNKGAEQENMRAVAAARPAVMPGR